MSILQINNVTMQFGGVTAVNNLNIEVQEGKIEALIGPNGAGKTTAFNIITGVYSPTKGNVIYKGENITGLTPDKITKKGIARTFQNIRLFKNLTVLDNILIANHLRINSGFLSCTLRLPWSNREERHMLEKSEMLLDKLGLLGLKNEIAHSLPYGEQRRLEIARALATDAKLLLLDEPAAGMNREEFNFLQDIILNVKQQGITILLVEHTMELVEAVVDHCVVLNYGQKLTEGPFCDCESDPRVIEAYLGKEEAEC